MTDIDIRTAQLIIQLARDDLYGLDDGGDGALSDLEYALAEQEREFMQFWMDYGDAQVPLTRPGDSVGTRMPVGAQANGAPLAFPYIAGGEGGGGLRINTTRTPVSSLPPSPALEPGPSPVVDLGYDEVPHQTIDDPVSDPEDTYETYDDLITFHHQEPLHLAGPSNIHHHVVPQPHGGSLLGSLYIPTRTPSPSPSSSSAESDTSGRSVPHQLPDIVPPGPIVVEIHNWPAYVPGSPAASVAYSIAGSDAEGEVGQVALPTGTRVFFREEDSDEEDGEGYVPAVDAPRVRAMNPFEAFDLAAVTNVEPHVECTFCKDHFPASSTLRTSCEEAEHHLCRSCVTRNVELCTRDETAYPPKCCTNKLPIRDMLQLLKDARLKARYEVKTVEYATPHRDRVYCCKCVDFLGSRTSAASASSASATIYCYQCSISTCASCKQASHPLETCRETANDLALKHLSREKGWQTCPNCDAVVELHVGCYHIKCRCATEFCYLCAKKWKTCGCANADEDRLIL